MNIYTMNINNGTKMINVSVPPVMTSLTKQFIYVYIVRKMKKICVETIMVICFLIGAHGVPIMDDEVPLGGLDKGEIQKRIESIFGTGGTDADRRLPSVQINAVGDYNKNNVTTGNRNILPNLTVVAPIAKENNGPHNH